MGGTINNQTILTLIYPSSRREVCFAKGITQGVMIGLASHRDEETNGEHSKIMLNCGRRDAHDRETKLATFGHL